MRLWHYKLIPFLPKSQLLAQWRELNSIFKKQDKHILINYIYEYPKENLFNYSCMVINKMIQKKIKITSSKAMRDYFEVDEINFSNIVDNPFPQHHNFRYLQQCFFNLEEKFDRGQKDFSREQYDELQELYSKEYISFLKGGK